PAPARSSGSPKRPAGVRAMIWSYIGWFVFTPCVISVVIQPGTIALTWMFSRAHAVASDFVSCTTPPLLAEYGRTVGEPNSEYSLPMLMTLPRPAALNMG